MVHPSGEQSDRNEEYVEGIERFVKVVPEPTEGGEDQEGEGYECLW